jgi:hypothetical protein
MALDRAQVVAGLHNLTRRVGVQRVTMRELAAELGVAVPSVRALLHRARSDPRGSRCRRRSANQERWRKRAPSRPTQPFTSRGSGTREHPCGRGPFGVVHVPAGLGNPGGIALGSPGGARRSSSRRTLSRRTQSDRVRYPGIRGVVMRVTTLGARHQTIAGSRVWSHAWIRSATEAHPGSSIMSWLILG